MPETQNEQINEQINSLTNEIKEFIKDHKENISIWEWKLIKIEDNKITLEKCEWDKWDQYTDIIMEIKIENDQIKIKAGKNTFSKYNDINDIRKNFKNLLLSRINDTKEKTINTIKEFFNEK